METENVIELPLSSNSCSARESGEICSSDNQQLEGDSPAGNSKEEDGEINMTNMKEEDGEINMTSMDSKQDDPQEMQRDFLMENKQDKDLLVDSSAMPMHIEVMEAIEVEENSNGLRSKVHLNNVSFEEKLDTSTSKVVAENGCINFHQRTPLQNHVMDAISGVKRDRMTYDDQQPSVHVIYNSLTRASKRKLEELLQQWSEWQAEHGSPSQDPEEAVESGEETFFPAFFVGSEKSSAVSFWIDSESKSELSKEFVAPDGNNVPMYDRGFALGLTSSDGSSSLGDGLEIIGDAARCFNCGSYSHTLKQCPKPRDNVAVNNARKNHKAKRNQTVGSCNLIRYYQNSRGGKFDGLKPGALVAETRELLGLQEFDPPPWLNRMREIGYPPGYLAPDDEDQPSGITIFGDEEIKDQEDGEIIETKCPQPKKKKTVEFPGINAPIPAEADAWRWAPGPSSAGSFKSRSYQWSSYSSETDSRGHAGKRLSRDYDDGPPGVDAGFSPSASYPSRYGGSDSSLNYYNPRERSPVSGRSYSDRKRSRPYDDLVRRELYDSPSHSSLNRHTSPRNYGFSRSEYDIEDRFDAYREDHSSSVVERHSYRHHRR